MNTDTAITAPAVINLEKGQKIDLTKSMPGLVLVCLGLGWNPRTSAGEDFDLDAAAICLIAGKFPNKKEDILFFNSPKVNNFPTVLNGALTHSGDNLTGAGDGDDETITIDLSKVPDEINEIVALVNIYKGKERNQNFGKVDGAYCRVYDGTTKAEIAKFDLSEDYSMNNAMVMAKLYRHDGQWKFQALGSGTNGDLIEVAGQFA